ncbi:Fanconi anemia complementation group I isoform X5 [Megalopta genalis]|uniref:Fanconi anemia complementation group I isoform X5 n=1 Tax=Megalopta genalis TaxID=115081 RepID=UPI003FD4970C
MYEQFQNLRDPEKQMELRVFIQGLTEEELVKILHTSVCKTDAPKIFDDILQAFPDSEVYQSKRRKLIESTLHILGKTKIPTVLADAIINRIIFDLPKHSKHNIVKLVDACAVDIRDHDNKHNELLCWKDLLPALLEALENEKRVVHMDTEVTGNEYKSLIVKAICNYRWNINHLPLLAKMFGDMGLDKQDRRIVIGALCRALPDLSPNQVPPFVYQALKLCKDRDNHYFFDTLCKYFESSYAKAISMDDKDSMESIGIVGLKELVDIESTVLYYVYQAVQLNHESLKDFIRYLKSTCQVSEYILQPFMLAVLMSVSGIYTDQIFEILKLTIVNDSLEKEKRQTSAWLRQLLPSELNLIGIVRRIIDTSNKDRHMVLKGLMELAFVLMSTSQKLKHNTSVLWNTGAEIIQEIIKKRHETVATVLQELIDKIVVGGTPMIHYTDCLKYVCRELSVIVLDHQIWIMTLLERLLFLPIVVADQVLFAILPLMNVSPNIRENLLLTLRKGLYRKGIAKRQMAVTGFLEMLKYSKMHSLSNFRLSQRCNSSVHTVSSSSTSTLTQVVVEHCTQREKSSNEADKTLCYEILDILKKSFTYEFEVRLHLYKGFYGTVARNPEITEVVLNMLVSHLNLYLEKDDILPPVKFELCIDVQETEVVLKEPIAELIFVIQKIYHRMFSRTSNISDEWHDILELLCTRMAATNLEHLNLEREIDFSEDSVKFKIKLSNLNMAITIYEALIAFRIGQWFSKESSAICDSIENLFEGYTRSIDLIKMQSIKTKKADGGKAKKNKNTSHTTRKSVKSLHVKIPTTIMDLDAIHQCLSLLYSNRRSSSTQCQIVKLCENRNFCCYILQTCEQLLQRSNSLFTDTCQQQSNLYIDVYIDIGGILYEHFFINLVNVTQYDEQIIILALQCFNEICRSMCTTFSSELPRFLNRILRSKHNSASMDINLQLQEVIFSLNDHFVESFSQGTDSNVKKKVPSLLLQIMERLAYKINFAECNGEKVFKCIKKLVQTNELEDTIVATIVQILLRLEEYTQEYGETLNEICLKLCEKVGTIDGNQLTSDKEYAIFREETFEPIYTTLNDCIKEKLSNASWLLSRLKAEDAIVRASGTIDEISNNNLREKERSLCKQLSYVTQILYTLVNTSIEPGPCTDITFKNLQCLYHLLGNLTKYFYTKSNGQNAAFQTVKFIQVIQLAGKPLKSAFYNLVTYLEENQNKVNAKVDSQARRNKILRETKVIPRVVYEIEQFNKEVLLLGKRTGIPLENHMKHSITRDFRIKNPQLVEGLEKMDTSLLSMSNSEDTESQNCNSNMDEMSASTADNATPSNKRSRSEEIEAYSSS